MNSMSNPALVAYREMIKIVVKELGITYPKGLKIASQLQKDVKEKYVDVTPDKLVKLATEQFKSNRSKYVNMIQYNHQDSYNESSRIYSDISETKLENIMLLMEKLIKNNQILFEKVAYLENALSDLHQQIDI